MIKELEDQEIKKSEFLQLLGCCYFDSQSAERLKSPKMKRKRPDGSSYLFQSIWLNQKSPDAEIPSPKMERKSKSFESSLTCAGDAEILSPKLNQKSPDAEILSPKMEQKSKSFEPSLTYARDAKILSRKMKRKRPDAAIRYSTLCRGAVQYLIDEFTVRKNNNKVLTDKLKVLEDKAEKVETAVSNLARSDRGQTSTPEIINLEGGQDPPTNGANSTAPIAPPVPAPTAPPAPSAEAAPTVAPRDGWPEEGHLDTNQRQQNDADQEQQNGQIGPWDPGIRLAEEPDSDHKSTTPDGTSGF